MVGINFGDLVSLSAIMDASQNTGLTWGGGPLYRKPGTSRAQFSADWLAHGAVVAPFFIDCRVDEYSQLHMPEALPSSLTDEERNILKDIDGIAFLHVNIMRILDGLESKYYLKVILPHERSFLHEESGSSPVKRDPPAFKAPEMGAREWRNLALKAGAKEYRIIEDGISLVSIPQTVLDQWKAMS